MGLLDHVPLIIGQLGQVNHIAALLDGVVMVLSCEETRWEVAQNMKSRLEASGANILGVIMNKRRYYIPRLLYKFV